MYPHPGLQLLGVVVLAALLARGGAAAVAVAGAAVAAVYLLTRRRRRCLVRLWRLCRQLAVLWFTLAVFYFYLTPGEPLWPRLGVLSPSHAGFTMGLERAGALLVLVAAVAWVVSANGRRRLTAGIYWCVTPFRRLGVPAERLAVRLALTLEAVSSLRRLLRQRREAERLHRRPVRFAAALFRDTVDAAAAAPRRPLVLQSLPPVPAWQWLVLAGAAALLWGVG